MCVFLVCVLVLFRASVCAFRVSELLVVRLSFVVKLFILCCVSCEILKFSCRISNSTFSFRCSIRFLEFRCSIRFLELWWSSNFRIQVPWIFDSNLSSKFSMSCSIRFLEFRFEIRLLECRWAFRLLEFRSEIRLLDSSALNFEVVLIYSTFEFAVEIVVAPFDFSNFDLRRRFSCLVLKPRFESW